MKFFRSTRGFTLLEMSVVLVIIALVIGGIFLTRSLIREAKLRSVLVEYDQYTKAIQEFQDKYQALPGDMTTATDLWGATALCPNTNPTLPQMETCNGNGNGRIGNSDTDGILSDSHEWWQMWQHLANAGLIDGRYNGAETAGSVGLSVPASKLSPGGWTVLYYLCTNLAIGCTDPMSGRVWPDQYGHILSFGIIEDVDTGYTTDPILNPSEGMNLDRKIDDGHPGLGNVRAWKNGDCSSGATQAASAYTLDTADPECSLFFLLGI